MGVDQHPALCDCQNGPEGLTQRFLFHFQPFLRHCSLRTGHGVPHLLSQRLYGNPLRMHSHSTSPSRHDAVSVSPDETKSEASVSQPARPKAIRPAHIARAIGFPLRLAAAVSKVVTATFPRLNPSGHYDCVRMAM